MRKFNELGIKPPSDHLVGDKIKINKILNKDIVVCNYRLEESKFSKNKSGKCLYIQIEVDSEKRVLFTGSDVLIAMIQQVSEENLPFSCQIVKEGEHFEFK